MSLSCEETRTTLDLVAEEKLQRGSQWQERDRGNGVDELWERVRPLIPERPPHLKGGRPSEEDRQMLSAILLDSGSFLMRRGLKSLEMLFYLFRKMVVC